MKLLAYSLRDMKADQYHAPFFVPSRVHATRLLEQLVQNRDSEVGRYTGDFTLYEIGELETSTGSLKCCPPSEVCTALSALPKADPRQLVLPETIPAQEA